MAFAAKFPLLRFRRPYRVGRRLMRFRCRMAYRAGNRGMIGFHFRPFDLGMAGGAGARNLGRFGIMGVMTIDAGLPGIVGAGIYLGKSRRS